MYGSGQYWKIIGKKKYSLVLTVCGHLSVLSWDHCHRGNTHFICELGRISEMIICDFSGHNICTDLPFWNYLK